MVKLRPYVVAVNHVTGCPRLESGRAVGIKATGVVPPVVNA